MASLRELVFAAFLLGFDSFLAGLAIGPILLVLVDAGMDCRAVRPVRRLGVAARNGGAAPCPRAAGDRAISAWRRASHPGRAAQSRMAVCDAGPIQP